HSAIDVALRVLPDALSTGVIRRGRLHIFNEGEHLAELAVGIEFEDRRLGPAGTGIRRAAMDDEDRAVGSCLDGGHRRPFHAGGKLPPVAGGTGRVPAGILWRALRSWERPGGARARRVGDTGVR